MPKTDDKRMWKLFAGLESTPGVQWINRPARETENLPAGPFHSKGNNFGAQVWGSGFPEMETPVFMIDRGLGRAPTDGETVEGGYRWLLSESAKQLFETLDPSAFHFVPVRTILRDRTGEREGPRYWLADVIRFLDAFDMESGAFYLDNGRQRPRGLDLERFRPEAVNGHLIFRGLFLPLSIYCTDKLKRAVKTAGLKGFEFSGGGRINA